MGQVSWPGKSPHDDQSVTVERYRIARVTVESHRNEVLNGFADTRGAQPLQTVHLAAHC